MKKKIIYISNDEYIVFILFFSSFFKSFINVQLLTKIKKQINHS